MRLLIPLFLALSAFGQTSNYPGSLDTNTSLYVAADNVQTTLALAMGTGDNTAFIVTSGCGLTSCGFAANQIATVCDAVVTISTGVIKCTSWEHMLVTAVAGQALSVTRGINGTSAHTHTAGAVISVAIDAGHQTVLKSAVIAIENALGPNLANLGSVYSSTAYNSGGTTTSGVQEAINAAAAAGGGIVQLPAGTVLAGTIVLPNNTPLLIRGAGIGATVLQLKTSTNADLITNANFATLTGSNTAPAGIFRVTIADMTLDGNKANESGTSWVIRIYGHGYTLRDLAVQNGLSGGIYSEYAVNPSFTAPANDLETFWTNIRVSFSGGDGIMFRGPHDSYWRHVTSYQHAGWCMRAQTTGAYNGNVHIAGMDNYLCAQSISNTGACQVSTQLTATDLVCSTAIGNGLEVDGNPGGIILSASTMATGDANGIGLLLTGSGNQIQGNIGGGKYALQLGSSGVSLSNIQAVFDCTFTPTACINNNSGDGGFNWISGVVYGGGTPPPLFSGSTPPASSIYQLTYSTPPLVGPQFMTLIANVSTWHRYHLAKIADGTAGCSNSGLGCFQVNGGTPQNAAGSTSQNITLDNLTGQVFLDELRLQTSTAFTGTTTATANVGNSGSPTFYFSGNYNLQTAVGVTNFADSKPTTGAPTYAGQALVMQLTTTGANVTSVATGSALDIWVKWGVLQ